MHQRSESPAGLSLDSFIGEWSMQAIFPGAPPPDASGVTVFEWAADPALLVQRWEVPLPEAPESALEFWQRFTGTFDADHNTITGQWEISRDGSHWEHDFDLVYTRTGVRPGA